MKSTPAHILKRAALLGAAIIAALCTAQAQYRGPLNVDVLDSLMRTEYEITLRAVNWLIQQSQEVEHSRDGLTDADLKEAAVRLGVDVATIRAVIEVEAGVAQRGFYDGEHPLTCFTPSLFQRYAAKRGINLNKYRSSHAVAFAKPNDAKYGSRSRAQQARLDAAMDIDSVAAIEGTFWGMFQIGGFNWKKCGAESPQQFAQLMSRSDHDQLDLFVNFLESCNLVAPLQRHDWSAFARGYNGPSYAKHGYHTKLAKAYRKWSN